MDRKDVIENITVSAGRLGLIITTEAIKFLDSLSDAELFIILKFMNKVSRYFKKG